MAVHYSDEHVVLYHGDCLDVLADLPDASIDAVVTDPPYLLGFMGREWDTRAAHEHLDWHLAWCREAIRVLKPGGHLLAFGGTRTYHRLACAVEDAGFEIRDSITWLYGAGFPKSLDMSKAIDKAAGAEREVTGSRTRLGDARPYAHNSAGQIYNPGNDAASGWRPPNTSPATEDAERWQGWGTALKPAHEPIVVARKPFAGTVAANVTEHGTGALNIDGCRVGTPEDKKHPGTKKYGRFDPGSPEKERQVVPPYTSGRWPANVVLDEHTAALVDEQSGHSVSRQGSTRGGGRTAESDYRMRDQERDAGIGDSGGASRFFYVSKAPASERPKVNGTAHPTVKPLDLMRWLARLVTPPGGTVLDPFAGSGTTAEACTLEGFDCIAVEREADYLPLIVARLTKPTQIGLDLEPR